MRSLICLGLLLSLSACEEENNPPQPLPPAAAESSGAKPGTPAAKAQAAGDTAKKPAAPKSRFPPQVPTASQLLDMGGASGGGVASRLLTRDPDGGAHTLFGGKPVAPSPHYANLKVSPIEVSPIERHWGSEEQLFGMARQTAADPKPSLAVPEVVEDTSLFKGKAAEPTGPAAKTLTADSVARNFRLVMFKLDPRTGEMETFDRSYASEQARDAARQYAGRQGFRKQQPSAKQIAAIKARLSATAKSGKEPNAACKFKAYWTDGGVRQSRCFGSQKELDAFTASRNAKRAAAERATGSSEPPEAAPAPAGGSLKPVDLSTPR